jgi:hypothetical protein
VGPAPIAITSNAAVFIDVFSAASGKYFCDIGDIAAACSFSRRAR